MSDADEARRSGRLGVIEPPIVAGDRSEAGKFLLLDGHLRVEILKEMGETEVACLISTDDEAFTYNRRYLTQHHQEILSEFEKIAELESSAA